MGDLPVCLVVVLNEQANGLSRNLAVGLEELGKVRGHDDGLFACVGVQQSEVRVPVLEHGRAGK